MYRSQVSLIFNDDKLYSDFVKPLSKERQLMPLIVKLISSYYYNEQTRQAVDGTTIESQMEQSEYVSDDTRILQEKLADIRASAQLLGMFVQDSKATLEEGLEAVNGIAKATGGSVSRETETGLTVPRINVRGIDSLHSEVKEAQKQMSEQAMSAPNVVEYRDDRVDELRKDVDGIKLDLSQILSVVKGFESMREDISRISSALADSRVVIAEENKISGDFNSDVKSTSETVEYTEKSEDLSVSVGTPSNEERVEIEETTPVVSEKKEASEEEQDKGKSMLKGMLLGGGVGGFY